MNPELYWISGPWRGRLAIALRPRGGDWLEDGVSGWRRAGLDVIASLLEDDEAALLQLAGEQEAVESRGMSFISFPIADRGLPVPESGFLSMLDEITDALNEGKNVAVHCRQSVGRAGLTVVGALIRAGIEPSEAIKLVTAARGVAVPETSEQLEWVYRLRTEQPVANPVPTF